MLKAEGDSALERKKEEDYDYEKENGMCGGIWLCLKM